MILTALMSISAEVLAGWGKAAPSERATAQSVCGYVDWGYHIWTNFFLQATYVKEFPFGLEPYIRVGYMDHPEYKKIVFFNDLPVGASLAEGITTYELGLSKKVYQSHPIHAHIGGGFTGNFCHWEKQIYGASDWIKVDQVTPGLTIFTRGEYWRKYKPWPDEEKTVNIILGLSARLNYMGFRPEVWPCPEWFGVLEGYVGVRW